MAKINAYFLKKCVFFSYIKPLQAFSVLFAA